jgi:hypothetical protein
MMTEAIIEAIRNKYDIPDGVRLVISEDVEDDGYGCCHSSSYYIETTIFWEGVPEGKKRKVKNYHTYRGTVWELIQELDTE